MTAADRATVAVVGAGPTGVSAAIMLADRGVDVLVLDRWSQVYPRPRAVAMDDEVHRILGRMGVAGAFSALCRPGHGMRLVEGTDRSVLAEFVRPVDGMHGYPESVLFDQPELERLLRAALADRPTARFRADAEVTGIRPHVFDAGVTVELTDRVTGAPGTVEADYVLGADGANSVVREAIGSTMRELGFAQRWLVADVVTGADLGQWEGVHQVCSPTRAESFMRIGQDRYRWEFQLRPGESAAGLDTVDALRPLLRPWLRGTPSADLELVRVTDYTFHARVADRWRAGRVFLLGDAAHLTPPFLGQGMGAGLRDAANLSWKIAAVVAGDLPEPALDTYEAERRPHATALVRKAVGLGRVMTGGGRLGTALRRAVLPRLLGDGGSATPPLSRSALARTRRRGLAGTMCPNAPLGPSARLDDVVAGRFALVTDLPVDPGAVRAADRADVAVVAVRADDPLGRWLADGRARAALVRPDGTVLATAPTVVGALESLPAATAGPRAAPR